MVRPEGFEPPTLWFVAKCSIQLSYGRTLRGLQPFKDTGFRLDQQPADPLKYRPYLSAIATDSAPWRPFHGCAILFFRLRYLSIVSGHLHQSLIFRF
jgi:hypothetical protein